MPAQHAKSRLLVVANVRHGPRHDGALCVCISRRLAHCPVKLNTL